MLLRPGRSMGAKQRVRTTKPERKLRRAGLGPLQKLTVAQRTKLLYKKAIAGFSFWMQLNRIVWPDDPEELDPVLCEYAEDCWQEGETKATFANLLSGLGDEEPDIKQHMHGAWRLKSTWDKHEPPPRSTPITPELVMTMGC